MNPDRNDLIYLIGELFIERRFLQSELRIAQEKIRELGGESTNGKQPEPEFSEIHTA